VCRNLTLPIYVILPRLLTCPTTLAGYVLSTMNSPPMYFNFPKSCGTSKTEHTHTQTYCTCWFYIKEPWENHTTKTFLSLALIISSISFHELLCACKTYCILNRLSLMLMLFFSCSPFSVEFKVAIVISFQSELSKLHKKSDAKTPRLWVGSGPLLDLWSFINLHFEVSFCFKLAKTCFWLAVFFMWTFSWQWKHYCLSWFGQSKMI